MGNNFKMVVVISLNEDWKGSLDSKYKERSFKLQFIQIMISINFFNIKFLPFFSFFYANVTVFTQGL